MGKEIQLGWNIFLKSKCIFFVVTVSLVMNKSIKGNKYIQVMPVSDDQVL